jgi:polar amino acid transport system substrate-binding protein
VSVPSFSVRRSTGLRTGLIAGGAVVLLALSACGKTDGVVNGASSAASAGGGAVDSMASGATSAGGSAMSEATSAADSMTSGATSEAGSAMSGATSAGGSAMSEASSVAGSAMSEATSGGGSMASGASSAATSKAGEMLDDAAVAAGKATLIDPSKLTVCTTLPFEPFESDVDGKVVGFDIDMMDFVAAKLGVETTVVDTPFEGIKSGEANNVGTCDIAAAGMTINPERQKVMTFSDPYFDANFNLVVPSASTATTLADMKGKTLGGQASTTGLDYLNAHKAEFGYQVTEFTGFDLQSQAILTGQVDGIVNDVPVLAKLVKDNADTIKSVDEIKSGDSYGFGMKKGNAALAKVVNGVLTEIKGDGKYNSSYKKWIGTDAPTG